MKRRHKKRSRRNERAKRADNAVIAVDAAAMVASTGADPVGVIADLTETAVELLFHVLDGV